MMEMLDCLVQKDMLPSLVVVVISSVLVLAYYLYATSYHGIWQRVGVPGPAPRPVLDHMVELSRLGVDGCLDKWFRQYGKTFGVYGLLPHTATLITRDLNLLKHILIKDFNNFSDKIRPRNTWSSISQGLSSTGGQVWKRHRHATSPMFTGLKMKMMFAHVAASAQNMSVLARQYSETDDLIPLKDFCRKFSTEVIARVGFGIETHAVSKEETEFAYYSRKMIDMDSRLQKFVSVASHFFPPMENILQYLGFDVDFISKEADQYFVSILESAMQTRMAEREVAGEKTVTNPRDMLDVLLNALVEDDDPRLTDGASRTLSKEEIIGNSTLLVLAGAETISTTFQSILYCLALYPEVQNKVSNELDHVIPPGENISYEHLSQLEYTEQVINECLRLFPLITSIFRIARNTTIYDGVTIPKGAIVLIPLDKIMKDPELWDQPEIFDPDRFSSLKKGQRDPMAFMPFGYGPRVCLGQRFAVMELKIIVAYLLRQMRFSLSERTEPRKGEALRLKKVGIFAIQPVKPIELEVIPRQLSQNEQKLDHHQVLV